MAYKTRVIIVLSILTVFAWGCDSSPTEVTEPTATKTLQPEPEPTQVSTIAPSATEGEALETPEVTAVPSLTPTLGPPVTRTPGPPGECPEITLKEIEFSSSGFGDTVVKNFEPQLLTYLNTRGTASTLQEVLSDLTMLDGAWKAQPQVEMIDVTGDTTPDMIIDLTFYESGQYFEGGLFFFRCEDGEIVGGGLFSTAGQVLPGGVPDGIRGILDMNSNGVPEIVHSEITIAGTHAYYTREFRVLEWDGQRFVDLIPEDEYGSSMARADTGDGVLDDIDGNGTVELILSNSVGEAYPDLGPQRARKDIWEWTGYTFTLERWEYTEPMFRIHAIWDGDDATLFGDYEKALEFYQQGVFDTALFGWTRGQLWPDREYGGAPTPTPDPEEDKHLSAYGRYRIMLLHVAQGNQAEAQIVYDTLQEKHSGPVVGSQYAYLAFLFWEEYSASADLGAACAKAVEFAEAESKEVLSPLGSSFYGSGQREYEPVDICPFGQLE